MKTSLLDVKGISVSYGKAVAVKECSFSVREGDVIALIGANGAGKTSVLKAISGMVGIRNGEIWFENKRIDGLPPFRIVALGIAHVPEGRRLFPYMSVRDNLLLGAYKVRQRADIVRTLDRVYQLFPILKERESQQAGSLSGGEQQMLAIGRGLMSQPRVLLVDEPTIGLAPLIAKETAHMLKILSEQEKCAIVLAEQNAKVAFATANYVLVMQTGSVVAQGEVGSIVSDEKVMKTYYLGK